MISTDRSVQAESADCRHILCQIVSIVLSSGGRLHPGARWRERDDHFSVACESAPSGDDSSLVKLPHSLLIPVNQADWEAGGEQLRPRRSPSGLTPEQQALLELHIALYNATGKLPWIVQHHPRAALLEQSPIVAALQALRPGFRTTPDNLAQVFLEPRVLKPRPVADTQPGAGVDPAAKVPVLIPLIDALNHHPRGAAFQRTATGLRVRVAQPRKNGDALPPMAEGAMCWIWHCTAATLT